MFFFFSIAVTTEFYSLSLHDALPIFVVLFDVPIKALDAAQWDAVEQLAERWGGSVVLVAGGVHLPARSESTRLNSSHVKISYAVFCLKKKKKRKRFINCNMKIRKRRS